MQTLACVYSEESHRVSIHSISLLLMVQCEHVHTLNETTMDTLWFTICTASMNRELLVQVTSRAEGVVVWWERGNKHYGLQHILNFVPCVCLCKLGN